MPESDERNMETVPEEPESKGTTSFEPSVQVTAQADPSRRGFVSTACTLGMGGALVASYGTFFAYAGRYLYPAKAANRGWMYVIQAERLRIGDSMTYVTPSGSPVTIARQGDGGEVDDFIALSSTCPHLGCQVHWEGHNDRFFCPCHNGVFNSTGESVSGPPKDAEQSLPRFPLELKSGLLYIEVSLESLTADDRAKLESDGTLLAIAPADGGGGPCSDAGRCTGCSNAQCTKSTDREEC